MAYRERNIYGGVEQWRIGDRGAENCWPGTFAKDNAAVNGSGTVTPYGRVVAGTIVAMGPDGKLHPCGIAEIEVAVSGALNPEIHANAAKNFVVGDEVAVVSKHATRALAITGEADDNRLLTAGDHGLRVGDTIVLSGLTGGTGLAAGTYFVTSVPDEARTIAITGEADDEVITFATAHGLIVGDLVTLSGLTGGTGIAAGDFYVKTVPSATTATLSATLGGATSAFTTDITAGTATVYKPSDRLLTVSATLGGSDVNFTTDVTAGTLTITGDEPTYENITGTRHVVTSNLTTGVVTLDGAVFSAAVGDLLIKINAYKPHGVLADHVVTQRYVYDTLETEDKLVSVALQGDGRMDQCPGITPTSTGVAGYEDAKILMEIMKGAPYADPMTGARVTPKFAEFTFRDV